MKNKLFKNSLFILLLGTSIVAQAQSDTVAIQWQQFTAQLDTIPIESPMHFPIAQKLRHFAEKHYPKTHSTYNTSLYHYATGFLMNGQMAKADSLFRQGWTWMQSRQPADTFAFAQWHTLKGNLLQFKKQDSAAIKVNDEAIEALKNTNNPVIKRYLSDFYISNASIYGGTDFAKMILYAQKASDLRDLAPHLYPSSKHLAYLIAHYHRNRGNYTQAIATIEKHLPKLSKEAHFHLLQELGHVYTDMRLYDKSIAIWKQILDYVSTYYFTFGNARI